jgi:hypothetical protein
MRTRACLATLLLATLGLFADIGSAHAQEKDAVTEMARRRFQEGVKFFDQKKFEEARAAFLQAYALKHHPAVLLNLAQSEIRSAHPLEAARHFSAYLRESGNASPTERGEAEKGLASARTKLGRIHVTAAAGAEVIVDGEAMGQAPLAEAVDVLPGTHTVEAKLAGRSASTSVSVQVGKSANATLSLEGPAAPPVAPVPVPTTAPPPTAPPPAETQEKPFEPPKETPPTPGESVQVSTEGREPFFVWLGHNGVGIAGLAATVIGAGVGTGFALAAQKAQDNADTVASQVKTEATKIGLNMKQTEGLCTDPRTPVNMYSNVPDNQKEAEIGKFEQACSLLGDNLDKRKKDRTYATAGFVLAGVGLAATITAYFATSRRSSPTSAVVLPVVGPGQAGLTIMGQF